MTHSSGSKMGGFMSTTKDGIGAKIDDIADSEKVPDKQREPPPIPYYSITARLDVVR